MKPDEQDAPQKNKGGRPLGSMSRLAKEARERAQNTGLLPHEILLSMARGEPQKRSVVDPKTGKTVSDYYEVPDLEQSKDAAKAAAPYYAPKISTVEVIAGVDSDDLDELIARAAAEAGLAIAAGREGEEAEEEAGGAAAPRRRRVE